MLKRVVNVLSVAIFAACAGVFLLFSVSGTGWKALAVPTGSMNPGMPPGSLAFVHRVPASSLRVGDIITYANPLKPGTTISHRIIKTFMINGRVPGFVTKGDANATADPAIAAGSIKGKVVWHVPHVGTWLMGSKTWTSIVLFVYLPALLIMFDELRRLSAYYRSRSKQPYKLLDYEHSDVPHMPAVVPSAVQRRPIVIAAGTLVAVFMVVGAGYAPAALALLGSNAVSLEPNHLEIAAVTPPPTPPATNTCSSHTNVQVHSSSSQTGTSGSATVTNNTTGGNATSGSVTNTSSTNVTVNTHSSC